MKKIYFALVIGFSGILLSACSASSQGFVALPEGVQIGITAVVVWAVSWAFAYLVTLVPFLKFLEPYKEPIALAAAAALIEAIQAAVPDAYGAIAIAAIQLVLVILAFFGVGRALKEKGVRFFK